MICEGMITKIKLSKDITFQYYVWLCFKKYCYVPSDGSPALLSVPLGKYELTSHILLWLNVSARKISVLISRL